MSSESKRSGSNRSASGPPHLRVAVQWLPDPEPGREQARDPCARTLLGALAP
ncbi:hypothetical protein [Streptomyces sp. WG5]|uniref:hypothetical protein n=1 Tax=Streptomyces sp. WG5 TaxID=3417648 RepID=UPI003CE7CE7C